jgi:hypothetical protein
MKKLRNRTLAGLERQTTDNTRAAVETLRQALEYLQTALTSGARVLEGIPPAMQQLAQTMRAVEEVVAARQTAPRLHVPVKDEDGRIIGAIETQLPKRSKK